MTRQRKEIYKKIYELEQEEACDCELGCHVCDNQVYAAFEDDFNKLYEALAATYGMTWGEFERYKYEKQMQAYENGKLAWEPYPYC